MAQTFFRNSARKDKGHSRVSRKRDENSLKGGRRSGVFDFQQKRGEIVKKETGVSEGEGSMPGGRGGRGRRMLCVTVILIASAPTEPWPIAEYLSAFLIKTGKFYVSSSTQSFAVFAKKPALILGCVWGCIRLQLQLILLDSPICCSGINLSSPSKRAALPLFLSGDRR